MPEAMPASQAERDNQQPDTTQDDLAPAPEQNSGDERIQIGPLDV